MRQVAKGMGGISGEHLGRCIRFGQADVRPTGLMTESGTQSLGVFASQKTVKFASVKAYDVMDAMIA